MHEQRDYITLTEHAEMYVMARGRNLRFADIVRAVADESGISPGMLLGPRRNRELVLPRHLAMYIAREECPWLSFPRIGLLMGGRDHTSIIHGCAAAERRMKEIPSYKKLYTTVMKRLRGEAADVK